MVRGAAVGVLVGNWEHWSAGAGGRWGRRAGPPPPATCQRLHGVPEGEVLAARQRGVHHQGRREHLRGAAGEAGELRGGTTPSGTGKLYLLCPKAGLLSSWSGTDTVTAASVCNGDIPLSLANKAKGYPSRFLCPVFLSAVRTPVRRPRLKMGCTRPQDIANLGIAPAASIRSTYLG